MSWAPHSGGSSPRMRGAPVADTVANDNHGIIPADAGSTMANLMPLTPVQDHPRGCGEHNSPIWVFR